MTDETENGAAAEPASSTASDTAAEAGTSNTAGTGDNFSDAMAAFYDACLQSAGTVVQNGADFQAELNKAAGASLTNGITQLYAVTNAATARAVALMATSVAP